MLLVDRVVTIEKGSHVHAYKNISYNEQVFAGHFPTEPVFPGVLIVEALAQVSALLGFETLEVTMNDNLRCYLVGLDNFKFRKPAIPGDTIDLHSKLIRSRKNMGSFETWAMVGDSRCCDGQIKCLYEIKKES
jgi:3-hydroxyacyl-[acyl-carrier-protein] dehydratase